MEIEESRSHAKLRPPRLLNAAVIAEQEAKMRVADKILTDWFAFGLVVYKTNWRKVTLTGVGFFIVWWGERMITRIEEAYSDACPNYTTDKGYCRGIGAYLENLNMIVIAAGIAVPVAAYYFWKFADSDKKG